MKIIFMRPQKGKGNYLVIAENKRGTRYKFLGNTETQWCFRSFEIRRTEYPFNEKKRRVVRTGRYFERKMRSPKMLLDAIKRQIECGPTVIGPPELIHAIKFEDENRSNSVKRSIPVDTTERENQKLRDKLEAIRFEKHLQDLRERANQRQRERRERH